MNQEENKNFSVTENGITLLHLQICFLLYET